MPGESEPAEAEPSAEMTAYGAVAFPHPAIAELRSYVIACVHGITRLELVRRPSEDMTVLEKLTAQHRHAMAETEHIECECWPPEAALAALRQRSGDA